MYKSILLTEHLRQALLTLGRHLHKKRGAWLVGGSCGLLLQGVELHRTPRDLDIYTDESRIEELHGLLQPFAVDQPQYSDTGIYQSCLSHYSMHGIQVELVGSLKVITEGTSYLTEVEKVLAAYHTEIALDEQWIPLISLAHELFFNVLRKRADRYEMIALTMRNDLSRHLPVIKLLIERNHVQSEIVEHIHSLLGMN